MTYGQGYEPVLSVIIPARNEAEHLPSCLEALHRLRGVDDELIEIILVDNGSTDATAEIARRAGVLVLESEEGTIAKLRNLGASAARAPLLAFVDADCTVTERWAERALEDFADDSPFGTPSGKIQLASHVLGEAGLDPLPVYEPTEEPPPGYLRLLYGRHPAHTFAKTQNTPVLFNLYPENEVWLSTAVARGLGIHHADPVYVVNTAGTRSGPVRAKVTERIRDDAVYLVHGHGHRSAGLSNADARGASDTELMSRYVLDPVSGGAGMRTNFVTVERA